MNVWVVWIDYRDEYVESDIHCIVDSEEKAKAIVEGPVPKDYLGFSYSEYGVK